ncbi:MAG: carboxypeptidase-like regulatory domain-containing protein [Terrimesophilobacter sp.]
MDHDCSWRTANSRRGRCAAPDQLMVEAGGPSSQIRDEDDRSRHKLRRCGAALLVATAVVLLSGCNVHTGIVLGSVLAAPACPVQRADQPCPPRPVPGASVVAMVGDVISGSTLTDSNGAFQLELPTGRYLITATNVGGMRTTATEQVTISDTPRRVVLVVDSGIR